MGLLGVGLDLLDGIALPFNVGDLQETWQRYQVPVPSNSTPSLWPPPLPLSYTLFN